MRRSGPRLAAAAAVALLLTAVPVGAWGQGAVRVSIAQTQNLLAFAPAYIARAKFFKEFAVDAQFEVLSGGSPAVAAVSGGSTNFGMVSSPDVVGAASRGEDFIAIEAFNYQTIEVIVNKEWAQRKAVNTFSPLKARVEALRGAIIGSTSPGALTDTVAQYLLRWAGLEPGKDAQIVALGDEIPRLAALRANRIQAMLSSPPAGEIAAKEGYGFVLIPAKDLPGLNRQLHIVLFAKKSWLAHNKEAARRTATAIALGNNFLLDSFQESLTIHESIFPRLAPDVLEPGLRSVRAQTIRNGLMAARDWDKTMELLMAIGVVKGALPTQEGVLWTNEFVDASRVKR